MFKELVGALSFVYWFAAKGRGKLDRDQLSELRGGAHVMAANAEAVMADKGAEALTQDERTDLCEAQLIDEHIEEMVDWLMRLEIV